MYLIEFQARVIKIGALSIEFQTYVIKIRTFLIEFRASVTKIRAFQIEFRASATKIRAFQIEFQASESLIPTSPAQIHSKAAKRRPIKTFVVDYLVTEAISRRQRPIRPD